MVLGGDDPDPEQHLDRLGQRIVAISPTLPAGAGPGMALKPRGYCRPRGA